MTDNDSETPAASVAVVGGGMLGMTLALRLQQAGRRVTLFESRNHLGGLADAWQVGNVQWDRHYHVTLLSDSHLRGLLEELGLDDHMKWIKTKTGFYTDGKLYSMSNAIEFLRFPPLGFVDKLRLGGTIWLTSRNKNWRKLENELVLDYLTRLSGRRTAQKIWLPLLKAKLGDNYQQTSAAFIWATINRLYAARRSGLKEELFGYMRGGYATTLAAFGQRLRDEGVEVRLGESVRKIESLPDERLNVATDNDSLRFEQVVLSTPSKPIPNLCPQLSDGEKAQHQQIQYQGIICASVLLRRSLSEYYVTNITDEVPFTGVIEMTALVAPDELDGYHLVYLPKYIPSDSSEFDRTDAEIEKAFLAGLRRVHPDLVDEDIVAFRVSRARFVMPIPCLNYSKKLPPRVTSVPGLFVANGAQLVNATLNVNDIVNLAEQAAKDILATPVPLISSVPK